MNSREKGLDSGYKLVLEIYVLRKSVQTRLLELREIKAPLWSHPWRGSWWKWKGGLCFFTIT